MSLNDLIDTLITQPTSTYWFIIVTLFILATCIITCIITTITNKPKIVSVSFILGIIAFLTSTITILNLSYQQEKHASDYTLSKDKTHFYVNSHTDYLKSAKFKILGENKDYIYVQKDNDTYNIPKIQERK